MGKKVVKNISSARKVFKFLRFVDEIKNISDIVADKENKNGVVVKLLALVARICGFFYYILDNMVWFSNMGMVGRKAFNKLKWKRLKDIFTLVKNWSEVFKSLIVWQ